MVYLVAVTEYAVEEMRALLRMKIPDPHSDSEFDLDEKDF